MSRIFKVLGLAMIITAILVVVLGGSALAAGPGTGNSTQNEGELCPCCDCVCGDCVPNLYSYSHNYLKAGPHGLQSCDCVCGDCVPNQYSHSYNYLEAGPHGLRNGISK